MTCVLLFRLYGAPTNVEDGATEQDTGSVASALAKLDGSRRVTDVWLTVAALDPGDQFFSRSRGAYCITN